MDDFNRIKTSVVVAAIPRAEVAAAELVGAAASAMAGTDHALADPIVSFAASQGIEVSAGGVRREQSEEGLIIRVARREVLVGTERLLEQNGIELSRDILREVRLRRSRGETAVLVALEGRMLGALFVLAERVSPEGTDGTRPEKAGRQ